MQSKVRSGDSRSLAKIIRKWRLKFILKTVNKELVEQIQTLREREQENQDAQNEVD